MAKTITQASGVVPRNVESGLGVVGRARPNQKRQIDSIAVKERRTSSPATLRRRANGHRVDLHSPAQSILFDVEGTLVDCAFQVTESWRRALQDSGYSFSSLDLHKYSGMDTDDLLRVLVPDAPEQEKDAIKSAQNRCYRETFLPTVNAFPGVRALLEKLRQQGHQIALATMCSSEDLAVYLNLTGAGAFIDAVACGDDKVRGKPHPDLFRLALGRLGVRKNAVAVGDTPYDAIAAGRAGIRTIGTMSGGFSLRELEDAGCQAVIGRLPQLLEFV
jgi:HAD superfamily hydrolase (TIGR01509 family)